MVAYLILLGAVNQNKYTSPFDEIAVPGLAPPQEEGLKPETERHELLVWFGPGQ